MVVLVVCLTCRKIHRKPRPDPGVSSGTSPAPDRVSNSSSEATRANTLSSGSGNEDLDGSDSLAEYHANYIKSQPDLLTTSPPPLAPKPQSYNNAAYNISER